MEKATQAILSRSDAEMLLRVMRLSEALARDPERQSYSKGRVGEAAIQARGALFNLLNLLAAYLEDENARHVLDTYLGRKEE